MSIFATIKNGMNVFMTYNIIIRTWWRDATANDGTFSNLAVSSNIHMVSIWNCNAYFWRGFQHHIQKSCTLYIVHCTQVSKVMWDPISCVCYWWYGSHNLISRVMISRKLMTLLITRTNLPTWSNDGYEEIRGNRQKNIMYFPK